MRERILTKHEAIFLAMREESHFFDRKAREVKGRALQKLAVAFANSDGGQLAIGLKDAKDEPAPELRWLGFELLEDMNAHLQVLFDITPSLDLRYEILRCDDLPGYVLSVDIEKSEKVHQTSSGDVYQRQGAQSLPVLDPDKLAQLSFAKGATSYEDISLNELPPDQIVDSQELHGFLKEYSPRTEPLEFVVNQHLVDQKTWSPRASAALLFHPEPSAVMPRKCAIKITRYETREDEPERDHLAEQRTIEGPSYHLIHKSVLAVSEMMSSVQVWTTDGLRSLEYPPEAIWEVIVNAVLHRDYSISDDIHVLIFDNRIEVQSPGRLPGYVTVENVLDARFSRNTRLVRTLNRYKNPPNKDLGEGLNTAFQKMKEWGLKEPTIAEEGNSVKVVLPHSPLAAPTEAIMSFLSSSAQITNRQARDLTGIKSENLVKVEFYKLRDESLIERVPELKGPKSAWRLTDKGRQYISRPADA